MTSPNVFLVSSRAGEEDRFTSHWHYLIDCHPQVAQGVVDLVAELSGFTSSTVTGTKVHPSYGAADRPDFLIRCQDYDLLFEHKLDSPLGKRQLERYVGLCRNARPPTRLALIANRLDVAVPDAVVSDELYAFPKHRRKKPFFLWEDFFDLVKREDSRLACDFRDYMITRGMNPSLFGPWGQIFTNPASFANVRALWLATKPLFAPGSSCRLDPKSLGVQARKPLPGVHLFYMCFDKVGGYHLEHDVGGQAAFIRVFEKAGEPVTLPISDGLEELPSGAVSIRTPPSKPKDLVREYARPLDSILVGDREASERRLVSFVRDVIGHLKAELSV